MTAPLQEYFKQKFWDLLADAQRRHDQQLDNDLSDYLDLFAPTLDEFKVWIDEFPTLIDVDECPERFLPYLGGNIGYEYNYEFSAAKNRKLIRMQVDRIRAKGSKPGMQFEFRIHGGVGTIEDTFPYAARFNQRFKFNQSKFPGNVYNIGAYWVRSSLPFEVLKKILDDQRPAGFLYFIIQQLESYLEIQLGADDVHLVALRHTSIVRDSEHFIWGSPMGTAFPGPADTWNIHAVRVTLFTRAALTGNKEIVTIRLNAVSDATTEWAGNEMRIVTF